MAEGQKLIIEKYLTYMRIAEERARARIRSSALQHQALNLALAEAYGMLFSSMTERAYKYRLATSAQAMVNALRPRPLLREEMTLTTMLAVANHKREPDPDIHTPVLYLPEKPIWIELAEPISTQSSLIAGLFFTSNDLEVERQLVFDLKPSTREIMLQVRKKPEQDTKWNLHFILEDGTPQSYYEYWQESQAWCITPGGKSCPTGECVTDYDVNDLTGERSPEYILPCPFCETTMGYWRSYFTTALLVAQGHFATSAHTDWPEHTETAKRKVQRKGSPKYDEIEVHHRYYLVNFDASVRKPQAPEQAEPERLGSWVAARLEIDPESVVYVRQGFGQSQRVLDPERNPRWKTQQTITVRAHQRRIPITVRTAKQRIVNVMASTYAEKEHLS